MYEHYLHDPRTSRGLEALSWETKPEPYIKGTEELNEDGRSAYQHGIRHTL